MLVSVSVDGGDCVVSVTLYIPCPHYIVTSGVHGEGYVAIAAVVTDSEVVVVCM